MRPSSSFLSNPRATEKTGEKRDAWGIMFDTYLVSCLSPLGFIYTCHYFTNPGDLLMPWQLVSEINCYVILQMLSIIQKLKKRLISYITDHRLWILPFSHVNHECNCLALECPLCCPPEVCRCLPSGMVSLPGDRVGGPGGLLEEELILCALRIPPPHFSWIAISFYFSLGTKAPFPCW